MRIRIIFMLAFFLTSSHSAFSQLQIVSLDPPQNALSIPKDANLNATFNLPLDENTVVDTNIVVFAERTGTHFGKLNYDAANNTVTFDPDENFLAGERVTATLTNKIKGALDESFRGFSWHFTVQTFAAEEFDFIFKGEWAAGVARHVDAADLNNDGYPDLIAIDMILDKVYFYLNDRQGNFSFAGTLLDVQGERGILSPVHFHDFNKDGFTDIYVEGRYFILINLKNGNFLLHKPIVFKDLLGGFSFLSDYDQDGHTDVIISLLQRDSLWVYQGLGDTKFQFVDYQPLPKAGDVRNPKESTFDFDNDGQLDLMVRLDSYRQDSIAVFFNTEKLDFKQDLVYDLKLRFADEGEYTNDLDGDGDLDHVLVGLPRAEDTKFIMYNDGVGRFVFGDFRPFPPDHPRALAINGGDYDSDGDIDLLVRWTAVFSAMPLITEGRITLLRNDGDQRFTFDREYTVGETVPMLLFLDYDLDGDLDIVGIKDVHNARSVFWMENSDRTLVRVSSGHSPTESFELQHNYPNPFNSLTQIIYVLPIQETVIIKILDVNGKEVKLLVDQIQSAGTYRINWNGIDNLGKEVSSGIYFVQMHAGKFLAVQKIVLLR